jgi:hypothetical protein
MSAMAGVARSTMKTGAQSAQRQTAFACDQRIGVHNRRRTGDDGDAVAVWLIGAGEAGEAEVPGDARFVVVGARVVGRAQREPVGDEVEAGQRGERLELHRVSPRV